MDLAFYEIQKQINEDIGNKVDGVSGNPGSLAVWNNGKITDGPVPGNMAYVNPIFGEDENPPADLNFGDIYFRAKARFVNEGKISVAGWVHDETNNHDNTLINWNGWGAFVDTKGQYGAQVPNEIVALDPRGGDQFGSGVSSNIDNAENVTQQLLPTALDKYRISQVNQNSFVTHQVNKFVGEGTPSSTREHHLVGFKNDNIFSAPVNSGNDWVLMRIDHTPHEEEEEYIHIVMFKPTGGSAGTVYTVYNGLKTNGVPFVYALKNMIGLKLGDDIYYIDATTLPKVDDSGFSPGAFDVIDRTPEAVEGEPEPEKEFEYVLKDSYIAGDLFEDAVGPENACAYGHGVIGYKSTEGGWSVKFKDGEITNLPTANGIYWAGDFPMICARIDKSIQVWPLAGDKKSLQLGYHLADVHMIYQSSIGLYLFTETPTGLPEGGDYMTGVFSNTHGVTLHSYGQTGLFVGPRIAIGPELQSLPSNNGEEKPAQKGYGSNNKPDSAVFMRRVSNTEYSLNAMGHSINEVIEIVDLSEEGSLNEMINSVSNRESDMQVISNIGAKYARFLEPDY